MDTLMQMTLWDLWREAVKTLLFYGSILAVVAIIIHLLVNDKQAQKTSVKVAAVVIVIALFTFFWTVGSIRLPAFDTVVDNLFWPKQATTVASAVSIPPSSPSALTAAPAAEKPTAAPAATKPTPTKATASKQREAFKDDRTLEEKRENVFKLPAGMESNEPGTHEVVMGDTVYSLGRQYNVSPKSIIEINGLKNPDELKIGDKLKIPQ